MHRFPRRWPVVLLAVAVVCGGSAIAWSQQIQPTYQPVDPAYASPAGLTRTVSMSTQPTQAHLASMSAINDDLAARVEKLEAAAAASKKKAASGMSAKIGGRMYWDMTTYDQNAGSELLLGNQQNGLEARAVRMGMKGSGFDVFTYGIEMDFATGDNNAVAFKDTYMQISDLPMLGNVKAGFFKEPFALEELTSSRFTTFIERNMANSVFSVGRRVGVMAFDQTDNERLLWQVGVFSTQDDVAFGNHDQAPIFRDDRGSAAVTMRVCGTPWYDEATNGRGVWHTGMAYSYRAVADGDHTFTFRPEDHLSGSVAAAAFNGINNYEMLNAQTAFVYGPFSIQSEYYTAATGGTNGNGNDTIDGGYVYLSYFLTGENRAYSRSKGAFTRVKPFENFFRVRTEDGCVQTGRGAWELAYRYSTIDVDAVKVNNHTFGVNWYLTPNMRLMANMIHSKVHLGNFQGSEDIFITRAQIDW